LASAIFVTKKLFNYQYIKRFYTPFWQENSKHKLTISILQSFVFRRATSSKMARHIQELLMCASAKIQNRLEKIANNNKEYGQKAATSA